MQNAQHGEEANEKDSAKNTNHTIINTCSYYPPQLQHNSPCNPIPKNHGNVPVDTKINTKSSVVHRVKNGRMDGGLVNLLPSGIIIMHGSSSNYSGNYNNSSKKMAQRALLLILLPNHKKNGSATNAKTSMAPQKCDVTIVHDGKMANVQNIQQRRK